MPEWCYVKRVIEPCRRKMKLRSPYVALLLRTVPLSRPYFALFQPCCRIEHKAHRDATSERNNKHMLSANIMLRVSITSGSPPPSERALPNNQYENRNQTKQNTKTMTVLATPTRELAPLKSCQPYISRWTAGNLNNSM